MSARRPGALVALAFAGGCALAITTPDHSVFQSVVALAPYAAGLCALAACTPIGRARFALIILAFLCAGTAWTVHRIETSDTTDLRRWLRDAPTLVRMEGTVRNVRTSTAQRGTLAQHVPGRPVTRFVLRAHTTLDKDGTPRDATGALWVRCEGIASDLRDGDRVRVSGFVRTLDPPMNPGSRDMRTWAASRGIVGRMSVANPDLIEILDRAPPVRTSALRERASSWLLDDETSDARTLLAALLTGQHADGFEPLRRAFARQGVAHMLAISGLHLGLLLGAVVLIVRISGDRPIVTALAVALVVLLYWAIVPVRAPIMRAGIMALAFGAATLRGRRYDALNILGIVALVVLIIRPDEIISPGFQLSFGVVGALIAFSEPTRRLLFRRAHHELVEPEQRGVRTWLESTLAVSVCAWAVSTPWIAAHFGVVSPIGWLTTLVLLPIVALLLVAGFASMVIVSIVPSVAPIAERALLPIAELGVWLVRTIDGAGITALHTPRLSLWWGAAATACVACFLGGLWRGRRARAGVLIACALVTCGWGALEWHRSTRLPIGVALRVDTLSVGDGAVHLVRSGREAMLIDCGSSYLRIGEYTIPRAIHALGNPRVRTVLLTHPDLDHFSGILDAAVPLGVRTVLVGESFMAQADDAPAGPERQVLDELRSLGIDVRTIGAGEVIELGAATLEVLSPPLGAVFERTNDASLVTIARVPTDAGERTFLFTGDIERDGMRALQRGRERFTVDAMEVPHHGSARPEAYRFVESFDPRVLVQSTGPRRLGDERWDEVKEGRTWWTTAANGAVRVRFMRDGTIESDAYWSSSSRD